MTRDQHATQWRLTPTEPSSPAQVVRVPVAGRFVAGSMAMVRELTLLGVGIGVIDVQLARRHVEEGALLRVLPDWALPEVAVHFRDTVPLDAGAGETLRGMAREPIGRRLEGESTSDVQTAGRSLTDTRYPYIVML